MPQMLETSVPGVFAAGDVRSGSTQRVSAAVGDGAIAIRLVHEFLNGRAESMRLAQRICLVGHEQRVGAPLNSDARVLCEGL